MCGNRDSVADNEHVQNVQIGAEKRFRNADNYYGDSWKIDRNGFCKTPQQVINQISQLHNCII